MEERLKTLADTIKENAKQDSLESLSMQERSSRLEEEFIGKAGKAR